MTGWDREYLANKEAYLKIFDSAMQQEQEQNVEFLEKSLAKITGRKYAVACNSGTSGNHLAYQSLKEYFSWDESSEIIAPANAFPSAVSPLLHLGLKVVLADINENCLNLNNETKKNISFGYPYIK